MANGVFDSNTAVIPAVSATGTNGSNGIDAASDTGNAVSGIQQGPLANAEGAGVVGVSMALNGNGVIGESDNGQDAFGVWGKSTSGIGVYAQGNTMGVYAQGNATGIHALCGGGDLSTNVNSQIAVFADGGPNVSAGVGVVATSYDNGAVEADTQLGIGIISTAYQGGWQGGWAALFNGIVQVQGILSVVGSLIKSGGMFKIDHPLDPAHKYLHHSFVESSEMKNIYDGVITLDSKGEAQVELPAWFEALNRDFRYQLTPLGAPAPNLHIARKVSNGRFAIAGGHPGLEISWQMTGVRKDAWAQANPLEVEKEKPLHEQGYYLHPELHGQPKEKSLAWTHHPEIMRRLQKEGQNP